MKLAVNIDHIATLREARGKNKPDRVISAGICELSGTVLCVHLREVRKFRKSALVIRLFHMLFLQVYKKR